MYLVKDTVKSATKKSPVHNEKKAKIPADSSCVETAISLMTNIIETSCERAADLDLMRLVNFMDLYRAYLQLASQPDSDLHDYIASISGPSDSVLTQKLGETELVSFERFVRDSRLIDIAATAVSNQTGEKISAPPPLMLSAND